MKAAAIRDTALPRSCSFDFRTVARGESKGVIVPVASPRLCLWLKGNYDKFWLPRLELLKLIETATSEIETLAPAGTRRLVRDARGIAAGASETGNLDCYRNEMITGAEAAPAAVSTTNWLPDGRSGGTRKLT